MAVPQPESHYIRFYFKVLHGNLNEAYGYEGGLGGVNIAISREIEGKFLIWARVTTDKKGMAGHYIMCTGPEDKCNYSGNYHFLFQKEGYEDAELTGYYAQDADHHIEQKLYQIGFVDEFADKEALNQAWNAQSEIEKLANSFITALAIIMVFKVLQGFSMERINPVA